MKWNTPTTHIQRTRGEHGDDNHGWKTTRELRTRTRVGVLEDTCQSRCATSFINSIRQMFCCKLHEQLELIFDKQDSQGTHVVDACLRKAHEKSHPTVSSVRLRAAKQCSTWCRSLHRCHKDVCDQCSNQRQSKHRDDILVLKSREAHELRIRCLRIKRF
jgi:hypothetical protein